MGHSAKIIADSICPSGCRITTMEVRFPRKILAEMNTHGLLAKNSASSRAIPFKKQVEMLLEDAYVPTYWGSNQSGMAAGQEVVNTAQCVKNHYKAMRKAIKFADKQHKLGLHKEIVNRYLEPYMWHTAIITATDWDNFFNLRLHKGADREFVYTAAHMYRALQLHAPVQLGEGDWHMPYVLPREFAMHSTSTLKLVSAARCARVSYLTHDKQEPSVQDDVRLANKLQENGHMSPFEHVATPGRTGRGRLFGWTALRDMLVDNSDPLHRRAPMLRKVFEDTTRSIDSVVREIIALDE